jgi:hypothetical protein
MNNTTTTNLTAIVAVLMAATLVVGTFATVATTQSAFAIAKKPPGHADKKTRDNGSGNSKNANTITLQKCKQAAIQSGWDNDQEQECENLICTHPGENATCVQERAAQTSTPTSEPTTTTLRVIKKVVCLATDPNCTLPDLCEINVDEQRTNPYIQHIFECESAIGNGVLVTLQPGKFFVFEGMRAPPVFFGTLEGDCETTIAAGQHLTCTITNRERAP